MISFSNIARILIIVGVVFVVVGGILFFLDRFGVTKWKIPGNLRFEWGSFTCVIALGTSVLLSILLTIIFNILIRLMNR